MPRRKKIEPTEEVKVIQQQEEDFWYFDFYKESNYRNLDRFPYAESINTAYTSYKDKQENEFDKFVGTHKEVLAEREVVTQRIKDFLKAQQAVWRTKEEEIIARYKRAMFAQNTTIAIEILEFLYDRAYDSGHSSGYVEVYQDFERECSKYNELLVIQKKLGLLKE